MDMTMSSATPTRVEVVTSVQRRRRWTPEQKLEIVKQTNEPGSSVQWWPGNSASRQCNSFNGERPICKAH